jgi:hypothetical protein
MERLLRIAGTAVGVLGGFLTGLWEIFLSPPYTFGFLLPVDPLLAVATNLALIWFTRQVTGRMGLALLPGIVWFVTMFVSTVRTTEGDLLITTKEWPGLLAMLLGAVAWGVVAYRASLRRIAPVRADPVEVPAAPPGPARRTRPPRPARSRPSRPVSSKRR